MKIKLLILLGITIFLAQACEVKEEKPSLQYGSVTDIDGNTYKTIKIGTQTWMAENLNVTHYKNGDPIANVLDSTEWFNLDTGAFCNYNNDEANAPIYGRLYNWQAVDNSKGIAPEGWHVPAKYEWETLINYLGGSNGSAPKIRIEGDDYWWAHGIGNNESGFSAIGAGARVDSFKELKGYALWWTSSENTLLGGEYVYIDALNQNIIIINASKQCGMSIRCIKD